MTVDCEYFDAGTITLQSGAVLPGARLGYKTYGTLDGAASNVVLLPTFYTGTHLRNEGFFGAGRAIDPARHFVISVNLLGNGVSSSPSNTPPPCDGPRFPRVTLFDNVACQHRLLTEHLGVERIALAAGWSMAGCQSYQWAAQYPDMVDAILPFCASAKTSIHNQVFLEGGKGRASGGRRFCRRQLQHEAGTGTPGFRSGVCRLGLFADILPRGNVQKAGL